MDRNISKYIYSKPTKIDQTVVASHVPFLPSRQIQVEVSELTSPTHTRLHDACRFFSHSIDGKEPIESCTRFLIYSELSRALIAGLFTWRIHSIWSSSSFTHSKLVISVPRTLYSWHVHPLRCPRFMYSHYSVIGFQPNPPHRSSIASDTPFLTRSVRLVFCNSAIL